MNVIFVDKWARETGAKFHYGIEISIGRFLISIGFNDGLYIRYGNKEFKYFYHYVGYKAHFDNIENKWIIEYKT